MSLECSHTSYLWLPLLISIGQTNISKRHRCSRLHDEATHKAKHLCRNIYVEYLYQRVKICQKGYEQSSLLKLDLCVQQWVGTAAGLQRLAGNGVHAGMMVTHHIHQINLQILVALTI